MSAPWYRKSRENLVSWDEEQECGSEPWEVLVFVFGFETWVPVFELLAIVSEPRRGQLHDNIWFTLGSRGESRRGRHYRLSTSLL